MELVHVLRSLPDFVWGFLAGEIKSTVNLDRELVPSYRFFAQATDGGGRWCRAEVKLTITDVNDNPPVFTLSQYTASVYEDTAPKALLTRIQAIDPDEGNARTTCTQYGTRTVPSVLSRLTTSQCCLLRRCVVWSRSRSRGGVLPGGLCRRHLLR